MELTIQIPALASAVIGLAAALVELLSKVRGMRSQTKRRRKR
jgi:hypothetical protein